MNKEKISAQEIEALRQRVMNEKKLHREILQSVEKLSQGNPLSPAQQFEILNRKREDEISAMFEAYEKANTLSDTPVSLDKDVQIFLFEHRYEDACWDFAFGKLKEKLPLCFAIEMKIIITRMRKDDMYCHLPPHQLSEPAEVFLLKEGLTRAKQGKESLSEVMDYLDAYAEVLSKKGMQYLFKNYLTITVNENDDNYLSSCCCGIMSKCIKAKGQLSKNFERRLISSGNHQLIMGYIRNAPQGLQCEKELFARANREEVIEYFKRYEQL